MENDAHPGNESQAREIERYLETGDYDDSGEGFPGRTIVEALTNARSARRLALVAAVNERAREARVDARLVDENPSALVREHLTPMVRGFFPAGEQGCVLDVLERSLVILTAANVGHVLRETRWDHTAWSLANLYLGSIGARLLAPDAPHLLGLSEETTCYLVPEAVTRRERFVDVLVHEAAHVFHCKRSQVGLPATRTREWLLRIDFRKRETFAYACEAYSAILQDARRPSERAELVGMLAAEPAPAEERVDGEELVQIVREALSARNGWKRILARCAPPRRGASGATGTNARHHRA